MCKCSGFEPFHEQNSWFQPTVLWPKPTCFSSFDLYVEWIYFVFDTDWIMIISSKRGFFWEGGDRKNLGLDISSVMPCKWLSREKKEAVMDGWGICSVAHKAWGQGKGDDGISQPCSTHPIKSFGESLTCLFLFFF